MDMESNHTMLKQKLGFFDTLKQALSLIYNTSYFILLTFLSSLPLFCFSVYYELLLQRTLVQISEFVRQQHPSNYHHNWQTLLHTAARMTDKFPYNLIQLGFLYVVPLHLLELCTAFVTVDLASTTLAEGKKKASKANFRGTLVTSIWVLFFSTCTILGSVWLASIYYVILNNLGYNCKLYFGVLYRAACMALLAKYLEWRSIWNMAIVVSILEDANGANALILSAHLSRGNERQGLLITLVFSLLGLALRWSGLYFKCYERGNGIFAQVGLFCIVNVMKWVVYMVYFDDCKKRILKKKVDMEMGKVERSNLITEKTEPADNNSSDCRTKLETE